MSGDSDSNARCLKAVELTFRFVLTCFVQLGALLFVVCLAFGKGRDPGVGAGMAIVIAYFTVAYHQYGRGNRASHIVAGLAGLTPSNPAATVYRSNDAGGSCPGFNPATGLMMMGDFDTSGNLYGLGNISGGGGSDDAPMFDEHHHSFNPANGLPMLDDSTDVHGNMYCTNSVDDLFDHSSSTFDDNITHSSFDDSFNSSFFDDDWNK